MDIKKRDVPSISKVISPNIRLLTWLDKKIILNGRQFPLRKIVPLAAAVMIFFVVLAVYALTFGRNSQAIDQKAAIQKEIEALTSRISSFMELPEGEQPTLATVTDRSKLQDQNFFSGAQDGDKLLIYPKAKKAILFRPSTGKLIDAANLTADSEKRKDEENEEEFDGEGEVIHLLD